MILPFLSDQREDEEAHAPLSLMSFGWIKPEGAATMRGAMVSRVINQLLTTTRWGALDYLVIDLPPGTGDVQLTLAQIVPLSCAIMVSTPHPLSVVDVARGVDMFNRLQVTIYSSSASKGGRKLKCMCVCIFVDPYSGSGGKHGVLYVRRMHRATFAVWPGRGLCRPHCTA